jgi:TP901 family phage tail tape measure protein
MANNDWNVKIGVTADVDPKKLQAEIDKNTKNIDINVNVKVDKTEAQKAVQKVFDKDKLDKQGREYFTKTTGILKQVKDFYKKNGAVSVDITGQEKANGKLKSFTAIVTEATGVIRKFNFERNKINTGGSKPNYGFVQTDNVGVLDKLSGTKLKQTEDFLARIQSRISDINSKTFNQSKPLLSVENSDKYNAKLKITEDNINNIKSSTKILSDDHKREIGKMINDLDRYRKELQNVEYAGTKLKPDTFTDTKAILQSQLNTNMQKWDTSNLFDGQFKNNVLQAKQLLDSATNPEDLDKYRAKLKLLTEDFKQLNTTNKNANNAFNLGIDKSKFDSSITTWSNENTKGARLFRVELERIKSELSSADKTKFTALKKEFQSIQKQTEAMGVAGKTVFQELGSNMSKFASWYGIAGIVTSAVSGVKQFVSTVVGLDKNMVDLQMSTGYTTEETGKLLDTYIDLGQELGATGTEVANAASTWLRQGKSIAETSELIKDSMILSKIGQIDSAQATTYLTSAMKGYKVEVSDVLGIVDKLSAVDLNSATSVSGLAEAMSRTANGARIAGVEMDKLLGMLAVVGEVSQKSMDSVGESFKTIFARMGNVKLGKFVDEDGNDITTEINDTEKILNKVDIKLRVSATEFRNFGDVIDDVGKNWSRFNDLEKSAISNAFAGVRQRESFVTLMENYGDSLKYAGISAESSGKAMQKFEAYESSVEAKTKTLQASFQELATDTLNSGLIKGFLDVFNVIVKLTDSVGLLNVAFITLAATIGAKTTLGATAFAEKLAVMITNMGVATTTAETLGMALSTAIPVAGILIGITAISKFVDWLVVTKKEQAELVEQSKQNIESLTSEISSLNTELSTTRSRIEELQDKGSLTIVEKSELDNLIATREELERIVAAKQASLDIDNQKYAKQAEKQYDKSYSNNIYNPQMVEDSKLTNNSFLPSTDDINAVIAYYDQMSEAKDKAFDIKSIEMYDGYMEDAKSAMTEWVNGASEVYKNLLLIDEADRTDAQKQKIDNLAKSLDFINSLLDETYAATQKTNAFNDIYNSQSFSTYKSQLEELATAGKLSPDVISSNKEYKKLIEDTGLSAKEVADQINALVDASKNVSSIAITPLKSYKDIIDSLSKNIKLVTDAQYELSESGYLNYDTVSSLLEVYPDLEKSLTATENGYKITKGALDNLISSELQQYKTELDNAINSAEDVFGAELTKQNGYDGTTESLKKLAQAKLNDAKATLVQAQAEYTKLGIGGGGLSNYQPYTDALEEVNKLQSALNNVTNAQDNYNKAKIASAQIQKSETEKLNKKDSTNSNNDPYLDKYNADKATLDHQLAMDDITQSEYYDKLDKLNERYFAKHKDKYLEQYRKNQQEIYAGRKKINEDNIQSKFDTNENKYNLGNKTEAEYYSELERLNEKYYKNNTDYADKYQSNLEKIYQHDQQALKDAYQKKVETIDKIIDKYSALRDAINNTAEGQTGKAQIDTYIEGLKSANQEITYIQNEIDKLNKKKITATFTQEDYDSQLSNLQSALKEVYSSIDDFNKSIADSIKSDSDEVMQYLDDYYDKYNAVLEKEKSNYDYIIDAQKEILQLKKDQADYEKTIADKTKDISQIESRMADLSRAASTGDRQANSELQKLQEDLADKKEDLSDTQSDHELELQQKALDGAKTANDKIMDAKLEAAKTEYETHRISIHSLHCFIILSFG